jgi:hypothetical protein
MIKIFSKTEQFLGMVDLISIFQFIQRNTSISPTNQFYQKNSSKLKTYSTKPNTPLYISLKQTNSNSTGYFVFVVKNKKKEDLIGIIGESCLMISEVMIGKKRGCLVVIKSNLNLKENMIISNILKGMEIESSTDFIKLKNDKDVFFNPTAFYDYTPQQNDIEDNYAGSDWERFLPKSYLERAKLDLKLSSSVEVKNKVVDYREVEVVNFYFQPKNLNGENFNKRYYTALKTLVYNNLEASKEKCFNFLFKLNNKMNFKMDKVNFQNRFNIWWSSVKDCGKYIDAPKKTKYIHYNPNALFSDDDQKKVITGRIVGLKRSLNAIERIYNLRQENPTLNKTEINKLYQLYYQKKGATSIRKYWETKPYDMEQEVMKINLEFMDLNPLASPLLSTFLPI